MKVFIFQVALLFLLALSGALGIRCYDCNSHFDSKCEDPFQDSSVEQVDCDGKMNPTNVNATFCRKMVQKINEQFRVIRSCGYISDNLEDGKCRRNNPSKGVEVLSCECKTNLCNTGNRVDVKILSVIIISALCFLSR